MIASILPIGKGLASGANILETNKKSYQKLSELSPFIRPFEVLNLPFKKESFAIKKPDVLQGLISPSKEERLRVFRRNFEDSIGSKLFAAREPVDNAVFSSCDKPDVITIPVAALDKVKKSLTSSMIEMSSSTVYVDKENPENDSATLTIYKTTAVLIGNISEKKKKQIKALIDKTFDNVGSTLDPDYKYKRTFFDVPTTATNAQTALAIHLKFLSTAPESKLMAHAEYIELAPGFSPLDLACFVMELLCSHTIPTTLNEAQKRLNLLFFDPQELKLKGFQKRADIVAQKAINSHNTTKYQFSNAVVGILGVLVDKGLITTNKSTLTRILSPMDDRNLASAIHTAKGYKENSWFTPSMQALLNMVIAAYTATK